MNATERVAETRHILRRTDTASLRSGLAGYERLAQRYPGPEMDRLLAAFRGELGRRRDAAMTAEMSLLPAAIRLAEARGMLPKEDLNYGLRAIHPDFTSSRGYRWPFPGRWAQAPGPILEHGGSCPIEAGDGICVGTLWSGVASGGISANSVLLVGWRDRDVVGGGVSEGKVRVTRARVVEVFTFASLLAERRDGEPLDLRVADLSGANLREADLSGANLRRADLSGADLRRADLRRANLSGADLSGANLSGADLRRANLSGADLRRANLSGADLSGADLRRANLSGSNLHGSDLTGANLREANLTGADLRGADLRGADLTGANLTGANLTGANLRGATNVPTV